MTHPNRNALVAAAMGLALTGCALESTPVPQDFSSLKGVEIRALLRNRYSLSGQTVFGRELTVSISHRGSPEECLLESDVVASLNGVPLHRIAEGGPLLIPDLGIPAGCGGTVFSTERNPSLVDFPSAQSDDQARTGVLEITDGTRTIRMEVPSLLDERTFTVAGPDNAVLVPGAQAVITWANQTGLVDIKPDMFPGLTLVNGWDETTQSAKAPAVHLMPADLTVGENRMEFTVPSLVAGKGFVVLDTVVPLDVTRCEGAEACEAWVNLYGLWKEVAIETR